MIYLDNAATTFPKPEVVYKRMDDISRRYAVNAGRGEYKLAKKMSELIDDTKKRIRRLVKVDTDIGVIFSPSITIALNQIINGFFWKDNSVIYVSPYEHNAVARPLNYLSKNKKIIIKQLPLNEKLEIDLERTKYEFSKERPTAVFCIHVSNVTGYVLPIKEVFSLAKQYGAFTVLDTAQSLGLIDVDSKQMNVDIIAFAGHKSLYGPLGIGGFVNVGNVKLNPFITGGTGSDSLNLDMPESIEGKYESASCNVIAVAGLSAALEILDIEKNYSTEKELTYYLVKKLEKNKNVRILAPVDKDKHIAVTSFVYEGMKSSDVGFILDEDFDIAVRTGYHCAPFIHQYLHDEKSSGTVRIGVGQFNTKQDIDKLIEALEELG